MTGREPPMAAQDRVRQEGIGCPNMAAYCKHRCKPVLAVKPDMYHVCHACNLPTAYLLKMPAPARGADVECRQKRMLAKPDACMKGGRNPASY